MTQPAGYYVTQAMLEDRMSATVIRRVYDDMNVGGSSDSCVKQIITDGEAMFEGYCRGIYDLTALRAAKPNEAVRLALDCVEVLTIKRFPRAANRDWQPMLEALRKELASLRKGETRLDIIGPPEPAANQGGYVSSGDTTDLNSLTTIPDPVFLNGWGVF